jgi:hypothetical protein
MLILCLFLDLLFLPGSRRRVFAPECLFRGHAASAFQHPHNPGAELFLARVKAVYVQTRGIEPRTLSYI